MMLAIEKLIAAALAEDIGGGDITTEAIVSPDQQGMGTIFAKEAIIVAGIQVARQVFQTLDPLSVFLDERQDGDQIAVNETIFQVKGSLGPLLTGERTALNFLQHLSGIATQTRSYLQELNNDRIRLVDTRKTTPGLRVLEKYAVRVGGAHNHRLGLFDGVLIKDNHIAVSGGVKAAVAKVRKRISHLMKIEVEVSSLDQLREALESGVEVIMLDNMNPDQIHEALKIINGAALVEVSGTITREKLRSLAEASVDIISAGALTHSARSVDISMNIVPLA